MDMDNSNNNLNQENSNTGDSLNNLYGNSDSLNTNTPTPPIDNFNNTNSDINTSTVTDVNNNISNPINNGDNNIDIPNNSTHPDGLTNPLTNENGNNQKTKEKKPINKKLFIIIGACIVLLLIIFGIVSLFSSKEDFEAIGGAASTNNETFFIDDGKLGLNQTYALFDKKGKMIYDFVLSYVSDFTNGAAVVKKDEKYALINTKGKEIVPFGKYSNISSNDGVFIASDEDLKYYLLDNNGKVKYTFKDYKDEGSFDSQYFNYSIDGDKVLIFDYKGNKVKEYDLEEQDDGFTSSILNSFSDNFSSNDLYSAIHYNGYLTIFDNKSLKVLYNVKEDKFTKIGNVLNDKGIILHNNNEDGDDAHAVLSNGKVISLDCSNFREEYDAHVVLCSKGQKYFYVNNDGTLTDIDYSTDYIDYKNYAVEDRTNGGFAIKIYSDGNYNKTIENASVLYVGYNSYLVSFLNDGNSNKRYSIADKDGNIILKNKYKELSTMDKNERIVMLDDDNKKYLIDKSEKKLSKGYDRINSNFNTTVKALGNYYTVTNDDLEGYIDYTGKEIIPAVCKDSSIMMATDEELLVSCRTKDKEYKLYSSKDGVLLTTDSSIYSGREHGPYVYTEKYDESKKKSVSTFYTLEGKEFYKR